MQNKEVIIFGAGMSGMIAAIDLARHGYKVVIHDREKEFGGDPRYNPSVHTTPMDLALTSEYIGIDIAPAFNPVLRCPIYFHDTCIHLPVDKVYAVERGNRKTSLDTLLLDIALKEGVEFEFNSELSIEKIKQLPKDSIIACGLREDAYQLLDIPYIPCYGWCSLGEIGFSNFAWIWFDECITEYGYMTATNNYYFNLLFSLTPVSPQALERYKSFIRRNEGVEHESWRYLVGGVVPMARADNPRLHHRGLILCGTISGFMDPFAWFGILGGILSGKISAMAVYDPQTAQSEFDRFNKHFKLYHFIKSRIWTKIRPQVNMFEKSVNVIGPSRFDGIMEKLVTIFNSDGKPIPFPYMVTKADVQHIKKVTTVGA